MTKPEILILDEYCQLLTRDRRVGSSFAEKCDREETTIAIVIVSTIQDADCIYVLDKGQIIESGSHEELLAQNGTYKKNVSTSGCMLEKARNGFS